jgi:lysine 6-dehydrogenase
MRRMARIIILGGGRQGRIIANDLAGDHGVTVADVVAVNLPGVLSMQRDLSRPLELVGTLHEYDVVVGALPACLGFAAAQAAVRAKRHYVDLSYYIEDAAQLHGAAQAAGVAIIPDCGLAPGLSNLIAGRALATRKPKEINIQVGGFAADPKKPYGYVITWSPEDLLDEYLRPARIIRDGKVAQRSSPLWPRQRNETGRGSASGPQQSRLSRTTQWRCSGRCAGSAARASRSRSSVS